MKTRVLFCSVVLFIILTTFAGSSQASGTGTPICGNITSDITLTLIDSPYVATCDIIIEELVTLTVEPGVEIQFDHTDYDLLVQGILVADGTAAQPIAFTAGNESVWGVIQVQPGASALLDYVTVSYAGRGYNGSAPYALYIDSNDVTVTNSTIEYTFGTNSPIYIANVTIDPVLSNVTLTNNGADYIYVAGGTLAGDRTLGPIGPQPAIYRASGDVTVPDGHTLTISPGVELRLSHDDDDLFVQGTLVADGTSTQPITFTRGIDSSWAALQIQPGASALLDYVTISYAGSAQGGSVPYALYINSDDVTVTNSTIEYTVGTNSPIYIANVTVDPVLSNVTLTNNGADYIYVAGGTLAGDRTLGPIGPQPAIYRASGDVTVSDGHTLTISPGVEFQLNNNADLYVQGALVADGTNTQPVTFARGNASSWGTLQIQSGASALLDYVTISYAGNDYGGGVPYALYIVSDNVTVTNSTIEYTYGTNSPIYIANVTVDPVFSNVTLTNNGADYISIASGTLAGDRTLGPIGPQPAVYRVLGDLVIPDGRTLTIAPGLEVQFNSTSTDLFVLGSLNANGMAAQPILFTKGGQSHWGGMQIQPGAMTTLDYVTIEYGGHVNSNFDVPLYISSNNVVVTGSTVEDSYNGRPAIYVTDGANPVILNSHILSNSIGIQVANGLPTISNNTIMNNSDYGLLNSSGAVIDARNNYWGAPSGPHNPSQNPDGQGDEVSDNVLFDPWQPSPSDICVLNFETTYTGNLNLIYDFYTGSEAVTWVNYLNVAGNWIRLWSAGLPAQFSFQHTFSFPLPNLGNILAFTAFVTNSNGVVCHRVNSVNTGLMENTTATPPTEQLQGMPHFAYEDNH